LKPFAVAIAPAISVGVIGNKAETTDAPQAINGTTRPLHSAFTHPHVQ